jgi:hypothetical protein
MTGTGTSSSSMDEDALTSAQDLVTYLQTEGHAVTTIGPFEQSYFLAATGTELTIENGVVRVFAFPNENQARNAADSISDDGSIVGGSPVDWISTPHFFTQDNLIALYVGTNDDVIDALEGAMGSEVAGGVEAGTGATLME